MVDLGVKEFYLIRKVSLDFFLTLKLCKNIFKLRKISSFGFSFFLRPLMNLSRCLRCFPKVFKSKVG
jgi:hypothetical protein